MTYQLLDPLDPADYERLKEDIRRRGIQVPIDVDEVGAVLDGHNRMQIAEELGLPEDEVPKRVIEGLSEPEKQIHVLAMNTLRRHSSKARRKKWLVQYHQLSLDAGRDPLPDWFWGEEARRETTAGEREHAAERQRFHRLKERIKPRTRPLREDEYDPWELANEVLLILGNLKPSITSATGLAKLEDAEEKVRQLAWGPED